METKIKEEPDLKQKRHDEKIENHDVVTEEDNIQKIKMILASIVSLARDRDILDTILRSIVGFIIGTTSTEDLDRNITAELGTKLKPTVVDFLKHCGPVFRNEMIRSSRVSQMPLLEHVNAQLLDEDQPACKTADVFVDLKRRRDKIYDDEFGPPASRPLLVPMHPLASSSNASFVQRSPGNEEQWRNIDVMLNCILSMVEKTIAAIGILQGRTTEDLIAQTIRMTEDRVAQVKKRAEEAVAEVNRKALAELQRAVTAAESRANQLAVPTDRRQDKTNSCWNCGRKAMETCSGCNLARYCGSFCQHKDWETHHTSCRREKFK